MHPAVDGSSRASARPSLRARVSAWLLPLALALTFAIGVLIAVTASAEPAAAQDTPPPPLASNDDITGAIPVTVPAGGASAIEFHEEISASTRATLDTDETDSRCYQHSTYWYAVTATDFLMSFLSSDDDTELAVHRSTVATPTSLADLEVLACDDSNTGAIETIPGETLWVAVSSSHEFPERVWATDSAFAYVGNVSCFSLENDEVVLRFGDLDGEASYYRVRITDESGRTVVNTTLAVADRGASIPVLGGTYDIEVINTVTQEVLLRDELQVDCDGKALLSARTRNEFQGSPAPAAYLEARDRDGEEIATRWTLEPDIGTVVGIGSSWQLFPDPDFTGRQQVFATAYDNDGLLGRLRVNVEVVELDGSLATTILELPEGVDTVVGSDAVLVDLNHLRWEADNGLWGVSGLPPGVSLADTNFNYLEFEGAPTEPGIYPVRICNDYLDDFPTCKVLLDFVWRVAMPPTPEVVHTVSCIGGRGRVDTTIVNPTGVEAEYRIKFEGLSHRARTVEAGDWWRMPATGRNNGAYLIGVVRDGSAVSVKRVVVDCDDTPEVSDEVTVTVACRDGRGYILVQFVNPTNVNRPYVVEFEGVPNRSQTAAPFGAAVRAVTGRSDGIYTLSVTTGARETVYRNPVGVSCNEN